jgi:hypothetical protein
VSVVYSTTPFTLVGQDIPPDAPRSMGMSDQTAADVKAAADDLRAQVLHLHADLADRTATISVANSDLGVDLYLDYGDGGGERLTHEETEGGADVTRSHDYLSDGVFAVVVYTLTGPRESAQLDLNVNWPGPFPQAPPPEAP